MRCVQITGSDDRMDCRDMFYDPINPLPSKCAKCGFPDLDHVPQPYFLVKSRTMSPNELAPAENGNFFIRERVRCVLDMVAPGQCTYLPTCYKGTTDKTPWLLAVPNHQVVYGQGQNPPFHAVLRAGNRVQRIPAPNGARCFSAGRRAISHKEKGGRLTPNSSCSNHRRGDRPTEDGTSGFREIFIYRCAFFICSRR